MSLTFRAAAFAAAVTLAVLAAIASDARAHVTLEQQQAVAGSTYKAVLRVPHGCEGSPMIRRARAGSLRAWSTSSRSPSRAGS